MSELLAVAHFTHFFCEHVCVEILRLFLCSQTVWYWGRRRPLAKANLSLRLYYAQRIYFPPLRPLAPANKETNYTSSGDASATLIRISWLRHFFRCDSCCNERSEEPTTYNFARQDTLYKIMSWRHVVCVQLRKRQDICKACAACAHCACSMCSMCKAMQTQWRGFSLFSSRSQ